MNFGEFKDGKAQQPLPPSLQEKEPELNQFHDYCHDLMLKILRLFAIGLKVEEAEGGSEFL
jgi:isopenicillin N synthase-like dioxygenase